MSQGYTLYLCLLEWTSTLVSVEDELGPIGRERGSAEHIYISEPMCVRLRRRPSRVGSEHANITADGGYKSTCWETWDDCTTAIVSSFTDGRLWSIRVT